jgi:sugar transferase (PEP-CTERM/EpsH1 system associated)
VKPLRVLFISPYLPSLIRVRPYNLIQALAGRGHHVSLLALEPPGEDRKGFDILYDCCARVQTIDLPRWRTLWNGLRAIPGRTPFQAAYSRSPQMSALVRRIQAEEQVDVVHVEHLRGAELSQAVNGLPIVFDSVDSIALLFEQVSQSGPTWRSRLMARLDLQRTRYFEGHLLQRYARVLATSPRDREALVQLTDTPEAEDRLVVLPNGVDLGYFSPLNLARDPSTIVFSGKMSYHANVAAALDLATQVMPHVWAQSPAARLVIAGKDPAPELLGLAADPRITVTGSVPDLRPYLAQATLAVTPIRYGVGIQNKVLEAMAMATPVVSTPQAVSALQVEPGHDVLIAETPKEIAEVMLSLLCDAGLRQSIGQAGRRYVETHHDWKVIAGTLDQIYREVIAEARQLPEPGR